MKKWFKKTVAAILTTAIAMSLGVPAFANSTQLEKSEMKQAQLSVAASFEEKGIDVTLTEDGSVVLTNPTAENIRVANQRLEMVKAGGYPTSWVGMPWNDVYSSKKFRKATLTAFGAALTQWRLAIVMPTALIEAALIGYGTYYFVNTDEEDIYFSAIYAYRELGPGRFDSIGNFRGDYEIRRTDRLTKNSNNTGGDVVYTIAKSTTLNVLPV